MLIKFRLFPTIPLQHLIWSMFFLMVWILLYILRPSLSAVTEPVSALWLWAAVASIRKLLASFRSLLIRTQSIMDISYSCDVGAATFATVCWPRYCAIRAQLCFHSMPLSSCKGRSLLQQTLERFKDVYQIQLATEQSDKNLAFYRELGFRRQENFDCTGMIYAPNKK